MRQARQGRQAEGLAAYVLLDRETIEAHILPSGLTEEEYQLIELQENSARNDLTGAQRKAYAAEVGQLYAKIAKEGNNANGGNNWFADLAKKTGTPERTLLNWWHTFCKERGLSLTPRQALQIHQQDFFA